MKRFLLLASVVVAALAPTAAAAKPPLEIEKMHVNFGPKPFESLTVKSFEIENESSEPLFVRIDQVQVGDDFSPGLIDSTCTLTDERLLVPDEACIHYVSFRPSEFFAGKETAILRVSARDESGAVVYTRDVILKGKSIPPR